ncbi:MAG: N-6 DNA methylase, partial [Ignavibacteriae bacterium]|nr:N-6 DNA methylase [Ignavibacteriota bacterium]
SDAFEELYEKLKAGEGDFAGADPEDKDEYKAENVFFVPADARWNFLLSKAKQPTIGKTVDDAMDAIEKENPSLKGVLPKVYARQNLDPTSLGELIDLIGNIALGDAKSRSADILGHVFEYFLGEFALAEGKKGGQFYTPRSVVELLVEMLEPYKGRVFDPCCGSGGMFVQSEKFVEGHKGKINDISIYGQESNQTTWRLAKMNLAIRGIDSSQVKWNNEGSFLNDAHKDLKCDFIIANPPFNVSDWNGDLLRKDGRWQFGVPPTTNANFAWIQHFLYHLSPNGTAGFVLANGALSSDTQGEDTIRKNLVTNNLIDCIVMLPEKLFLNTGISASLWFLRRNRSRNDVLFIDATSLGKMISRKNRIFEENDINKIANKYSAWKNSDGYKDEISFCKSCKIDDIVSNNYILTPGRYVGDSVDPIDKIPFLKKLQIFSEAQELEKKKNQEINSRLIKVLNKVYPNINWSEIDLNSIKVIDYFSNLLFEEWIELNKSPYFDNGVLKYSSLENFVSKSNTGADAIQKAPIVEEDTGIRCLRIGDITNERDFDEWGFSKVKPEIYKQYKLEKNDIIVTRTSVLGLTMFISEDLKSVYNNGLIRLKVKRNIRPEFIYANLNSNRFHKYIKRITNETSTRPNMKMNYLLNYKIPEVSETVMNEFSNIYSILLEKRNYLKYQNINLITAFASIIEGD